MQRLFRAILVVLFVFPVSLSAAQLERLPSTGARVSDLIGRLKPIAASHKANVIFLETEDYGFLIPAAGNLQGGNGTFFKSDLAIANRRAVAQTISIAWFARGVNSGNDATFDFVIPANTTVFERDFVGRILGKTGLGAILVVGITAGGDIDDNAELDGFSRIWTPQPGSAGTVSQEFTSVSIEDSLATSYGYGLRQDSGFRSNIGFVNIWDTPNSYTVNIVGTGGNTSFTQNVQAYSMEQVPAPGGNWGDFYIRVESGATNFNWWTAYGSSTDNVTGDGWVTHVH